jgi:Domain of unknown function (DUF4342)
MLLDRKSGPGLDRKKRIVMTQTDPKIPRGGQFQGFHEEFHVASGDMVDTVKSLIHEGNIRRIIKHEGYNILEIPVTVALIGTLLVPWLAAVGAISGVITHCTLEVVRTEHTSEASRSLEQAVESATPHHSS